jgi:hypothetical protein
MSNKSILLFCIFNGLVHNDSNSNLRHHICCYITNLTYDKLIMKIMRSSFIHKFIHFKHEYHALKTHLTHGCVCLWTKYKPMNE